MKNIQYLNTLFYYDGPQVFEARDSIGGHYIAVKVKSDVSTNFITPSDSNSDRYLIVGVAPEILRNFRAGAIDLRTLLVESEVEEQYIAIAKDGVGGTLELNRLPIPLSKSGFLPDEGFLLRENTSTGVLREAKERNNLVMEIIAEPPEASVGHRIRVNTLAGMLYHFQLMVGHAYRKAHHDLGVRLSRQSYALLDVVVPAAEGSFKVVLESADMPNMFGESDLEFAFLKMDDLFEQSFSPPHTLDYVIENRGHLASAYLKFLRFLDTNRTGLRYSWASPNSKTVTGRAILENDTKPLIEVLSSVEKLEREEVVIEGSFEKFNRNSGLWGLVTENGAFSGKIGEKGSNLDGLEVGGLYRFYCEEEIEEVLLTGKEKRTLYLYRHEKV